MNPFRSLVTVDGYRVALVDAPWKFNAWSVKGDGRSAVQHYDVMTVEAIAALPVGDICAKDCALFMWATWPMIEQAFTVIKAWGFTYKTNAFTWVKTNKGNGEPSLGLGFWTRSNSEICLLATRGKPKRINSDVGQIILEPKREHSRKPDCVYDRIERLVGGPYVELFARHRRAGWDSWGKGVS